MVEKNQTPGCRDAATVTALLLGFAIVFMIAGLTLANRGGCDGVCETVALTLLYAGGPISAILGVVFGDLWLAWPLEVTFWVVAGFMAARWADRRLRAPLAVGLVIVLFALAYGLVLSLFVEIAV